MAPHSSPLPGKSHGRRSLVSCSPWGRSELDTIERLHFHFSLSCIGEGNGNPLQCSWLENPRGGGAWWASVCGVAQSRTQLKQLSSSSSRVRSMGTKAWKTCCFSGNYSRVGKICWRRDRLPTPVFLGFTGGSAGKESACNVGDLSLIPGLGRSPGEGKAYPPQYSGLENSMDYSMGSQKAGHD